MMLGFTGRKYVCGVVMLAIFSIVPIVSIFGSDSISDSNSIFIKHGCQYVSNGYINCRHSEKLRSYKCSMIKEVDESFGALNPRLPIVFCIRQIFEGNKLLGFVQPHIFSGGGKLRYYVTYVVYDGRSFREIKTPVEFKAFFAPVDSAEEAIAFAAAISGKAVFREIRFTPLKNANVVPTRAMKIGDTYKVNLFDRQQFGCGTRPILEVIYLVNTEGDVVMSSSRPVYDPPEDDGICVD